MTPAENKFGREVYETEAMLRIYDCDRTALHRNVKAGKIPAPLRFGKRNYWDAATVKGHLNSLFDTATKQPVAA